MRYNLLKRQKIWRELTWTLFERRQADMHWIANRLPDECCVVPVFQDQCLFFSCLFAAVTKGTPCLFLSDHSLESIKRLRSDFCCIHLVTDRDSHGTFKSDEVLRIASTTVDSVCNSVEKLVMDPAGDQIVLKVFSSGSTGIPRFYSKTWTALIEEARMIDRSLKLGDHARHLISTVPPNHMYGFSYGLFGPLHWGMSIDAERPVFPLDLRRVLLAAPDSAWVVTTPTHLRAYMESAVELPKLAGFICSTAPLPLELARSVEERFGCALIETYGSTETGAIAWRHPTQGQKWTCYDAISISMDEQMRVYAPHLPLEGQSLDDRVRLLDKSHFEIIGRSSDLVKIAGKRASLFELNAKLCDIPDVKDGTFFIPPKKADQPQDNIRLGAFVVSDEQDPQIILDELRNRIDQVFLPRPLVMVSELPRDANSKLPRAALEKLWYAHFDKGRALI
uniref:AMP-binding enzyme n=1 Tax=Candidatus Kentrum sp. FM TaxID=2126340 RepID=A0A450VS19_9GAMM|nr:MAG: AMP-binding enzyme [Candidatus Kentron sp. FM]VFJ47365.1 MAG: AMP-binding enzyme [Candidatus Kentron sp. FM]VFK07567.1 MAG: AMP-binding enzyme [Candidatus Kentron sp. FM]